MLMRSGSFTRPRPLVEFDCGSQSTSRVLTSAAAKEAARLMAVVVLPTPPFWLAMAITRAMQLVLSGSRHLHIAVDDTNGKRMADDASASRVTEAETGFNGDLLWATVDSVDNAGESAFF